MPLVIYRVRQLKIVFFLNLKTGEKNRIHGFRFILCSLHAYRRVANHYTLDINQRL